MALVNDNARIQVELSKLQEFLNSGDQREAIACRERLDQMLIDYPEAFNLSLQAIYSLRKMHMDGELKPPKPPTLAEAHNDFVRDLNKIVVTKTDRIAVNQKAGDKVVERLHEFVLNDERFRRIGLHGGALIAFRAVFRREPKKEEVIEAVQAFWEFWHERYDKASPRPPLGAGSPHYTLEDCSPSQENAIKVLEDGSA